MKTLTITLLIVTGIYGIIFVIAEMKKDRRVRNNTFENWMNGGITEF
jgi:hypothetical protein